MGSSCHDECNFHDLHAQLPSDVRNQFGTWVKQNMKMWKAQQQDLASTDDDELMADPNANKS